MKIAREIFDELSDRFDLYSHEQEEVESIISAKLEPVRDALRQHIERGYEYSKGLMDSLDMLEDE